jgi:hypothetical protein
MMGGIRKMELPPKLAAAPNDAAMVSRSPLRRIRKKAGQIPAPQKLPTKTAKPI